MTTNLIADAIDAMKSLQDRDRVLSVRRGLGPDSCVAMPADGAGRGRATSKSVIGASGGQIAVWSAAGPFGAAFSFILPAAEA